MNKEKDVDLEKLREEAKEWIQQHLEQWPIMRSCWECNPAHEHLKNIDYPFWCLWCDRYFYKGVDITEYENEEDEDDEV